MYLGDEVRCLNPIPPASWQSFLVAGLLFLLFGSIVVNLEVGLVIFYALALLGVVTYFRPLESLPFSDAEQTGFLILLVFFLISLLTFWINGMPGRGDMFVESRHAKFLLVIPVYLFFRSFPVSPLNLWLLAVAVAVCLFFVSLVDINTVDGFGWPGRASGAANPNDLAVLSLTMLSLIIAFRDTWGGKRWPRNMARLGIAAGLIALVLTKSLSLWFAFVLLIIMYVLSRIERLRIRHILEVGGALLCLLVVLYQIPFIKNELNIYSDDFSAYRESDSSTDQGYTTDTGIMLDNWRAAITMIRENPLLGVGAGGYQATAKRLVETGAWSPTIGEFEGPNNLYLSAFSTRGLFGFITTLLLMLAPLLYSYRIRRRIDDSEVRQYAFAVMLVVVVFLVAGLSIDVLEAKPLLLIYCTVLALLLGQIRLRVEN